VFKRLSLAIFLTFYFLLLTLPAFAAEYDGIWFLGFNLRQPPFDNLNVRQAVVCALTSAEADGSFIPPGMAGYDTTLPPNKYNLKYAALLLKRAGYKTSDQRLKHLTLLHTDGLRTIAIARQIRADLRALGLRLELVEVSYRDAARWEKELRSGKHQLFLMGYKAGAEQLFTAEAAGSGPESADLLEPLFKTGGAANFTGYSSPAVDMLLDQLSVIAPAMTMERELKFREINKTLYRDRPAVVLFYIEKL